MQIICPECHTPRDYAMPLKDTTLTCKKCKTIFLTPLEAMPKKNQRKRDLIASIEALEKTYALEKKKLETQLEDRFKKAKKQLEKSYVKENLKTEIEGETEDIKSVKRPIANKLLRIVLAIYFIAVVAVNSILMISQYDETKNLISLDLRSSQKIFGDGLAEAIWNMDDTGLEAITSGMLEYPVIVGVKILDEDGEEQISKGVVKKDGEIFISADEDKWSDGKDAKIEVSNLFEESFPILYTSEDGEKRVAGKATVYSDTGLIFKRVKMGYWLLAVNGIAVAIVLCIAFLWVSRIFLGQPLSMLTNAVSSVNLDTLDTLEVNVNTADRNEFKILEESFNDMVHNLIEEKKTILQMSSTFEKFIPKQFLSRIAEKGIGTIRLGGMESEHLSILYARIQSFDDISEHLDSEQQFHFLNSYLSRMEVPIEKHGGFIFQLDKTSIMALFALNDVSMEALSAVYAAIDMQKAVVDFNEDQQKANHPPIAIGIGIHSGEALLGTLGNETRLEPTIIGESIESAVQLEELTGHYNIQILISNRTFSLLRSFDAFKWRKLDYVGLKHTTNPEAIYEVFDADPAVDLKEQIIEPFHEGLENFEDQNWDLASEFFESCLKIYPLDVVTQMYIKRCNGYKTDDTGIVDFLRNESDVFKSLNDISIVELSRLFEKSRFEKDEIIVRYNEIGDAFYVVRSGRLDVILPGEDGNEISMATLSKGDCFGEMSLMTGEPAVATIKGLMSGELLILNREQFESMLSDYTVLNSYFNKLFLKRLVEDKAKLIDK